MSKEEAMQRYIDDFVTIVDSTTLGSNVEEMIKSLGTLYEAVNDEDIDLLLGPTIDRLFAKSGCRKLARMKDKIFKSGDIEEKSSEEVDNFSDEIDKASDKQESSSVIPMDGLDGEDRRFETKQSQYYAAPSQIEEEQVRDAYQLKSGCGEGRSEKHGERTSVTTWSQCVQQSGEWTLYGGDIVEVN